MRLQSLMYFGASVAIALAAEGCASSGNVAPAVTPAMVNAAHGASAQKLSEGRRIFTGPCASCHAPDLIGKYSLSEWHAAVVEMASRAKLDSDARAALLAYISAAKAAESDL